MALNKAQRERMARGWEHHRNRRYAEAEPFYRLVLKQAPREPEVLHLLGVAVMRQGRPAEAVSLIERAAEGNPRSVEIQNDLGNALKAADRPLDALEHYNIALERAPERAEIHNNVGNAFLELRRYEDALKFYARALSLKANYPEAHRNVGQVFAAQRRWPEALAAADRAIALRPTYGAAHGDRGRALTELRRPVEAYVALRRALDLAPTDIDVIRQAIPVVRKLRQFDALRLLADRLLDLVPDDPEALFAKGTALWKLHRAEEAHELFQRVVEAAPNSAGAWNARGSAELQMNDVEAAVASFRRAIALDPDAGDGYSNLGVALLALHCYDEAVEATNAALARDPGLAGARFNRGLMMLQQSGFREGWRDAESRKLTEDLISSDAYRDTRYSQPLWLGDAPIKGKTLYVYPEQGLGDSLQFIRYAPVVAGMGANVVVSVQAPLQRLLSQLAPSITVIGPRDVPEAFDYHCPMMSLPLAVHEAGLPVPASDGYLHADPTLVAGWRDRLGPRTGRRIGIAWSGNPAHANDRNRSMPLAALAPLIQDTNDITWVVAQKDVSAADAAQLRAWRNVVQYGDQLGDFADTAALFECLDLIVAVDTSVAHLAGALGRPLWLLLPYAGEWRWSRSGEATVWYNSATLVRQTRRGDWGGVVETLRQRLASVDR